MAFARRLDYAVQQSKDHKVQTTSGIFSIALATARLTSSKDWTMPVDAAIAFVCVVLLLFGGIPFIYRFCMADFALRKEYQQDLESALAIDLSELTIIYTENPGVVLTRGLATPPSADFVNTWLQQNNRHYTSKQSPEKRLIVDRILD